MSWNFYKLKRRDLISGGIQFCRKSELFGRPFCISILKVLWSQIHCHPLDINVFCMMQEYFLKVLKFLQIKQGEPNFLGEPILQNVWIIWSPLLYLSLKSPIDQNSSAFIRFQFILHESGRLFSESWSFYKLRRGDLISGGTNFAECLNHLVPPSVFKS